MFQTRVLDQKIAQMRVFDKNGSGVVFRPKNGSDAAVQQTVGSSERTRRFEAEKPVFDQKWMKNNCSTKTWFVQPCFGRKKVSQPLFGRNPVLAEKWCSTMPWSKNVFQPWFGRLMFVRRCLGRNMCFQPVFGRKMVVQPLFGRKMVPRPCVRRDKAVRTKFWPRKGRLNQILAEKTSSDAQFGRDRPA